MRGKKEIERLQRDLGQAIKATEDVPGLSEEERERVTYLQSVLNSLSWTLGKRGTKQFRTDVLLHMQRLQEMTAAVQTQGGRRGHRGRQASSPINVNGGSPASAAEEEATSSGSVGRLIKRAERIDWRYKLQLTVGICLAVAVPFYLLQERIVALEEWGYAGAFGINLVSSATIILPAPGGVLIAIMGQDFFPLFIGIAAGVGGTIGGATAYLAGALNSAAASQKGWMKWLQGLMARFGSSIIFIFALMPILPGDVASLIAGGVRYPFKRYLVYNGLGSIIKMTGIAYFGAEALAYLERFTSAWLHSGV